MGTLPDAKNLLKLCGEVILTMSHCSVNTLLVWEIKVHLETFHKFVPAVRSDKRRHKE